MAIIPSGELKHHKNSLYINNFSEKTQLAAVYYINSYFIKFNYKNAVQIYLTYFKNFCAAIIPVAEAFTISFEDSYKFPENYDFLKKS